MSLLVTISWIGVTRPAAEILNVAATFSVGLRCSAIVPVICWLALPPKRTSSVAAMELTCWDRLAAWLMTCRVVADWPPADALCPAPADWPPADALCPAPADWPPADPPFPAPLAAGPPFPAPLD